NQRESYVRHRIDVDSVNYHENSLAGNTPEETPPEEGGYEHYLGKVSGRKTREKPSANFDDHFSQPRMFWNSMSFVEKQQDRKSTRLNSSHVSISYAVFCLKKKR